MLGAGGGGAVWFTVPRDCAKFLGRCGQPVWGIENLPKSIFQQRALDSGLVSQADLDAAIASFSSAGDASRPVGDEQLSKKLVELGKLNRWQAQNLRRADAKAFQLGPYRVIDFLGQGGMGEVYKAEHSIMGRAVAVKVLPPHKSTPESIASFAREIRTQAQLDHENLVRAYDAGHDKNVHFLVTEYVPGINLRNLIRREGRLSMREAASIISQAARGLAYAHSRGLIHRDVKPGNLLVTPDGHCKVSDLGLSGYFEDAEQTDIHGGKVVGTADYLAPEQITAPDRPTPVSDVYSLGCTLYYAVTGKVPFPGGSAKEKARKHCQVPPLDPRRLNPELSDDFVEVIGDMMAKDPAERIQSAGEVMARLAPWANASVPVDSSPLRSSASASFGFDSQAAYGGAPQGVSDTEPIFPLPADDASQIESSSQLSLGTQPMSAATQETMPLVGLERASWNPTFGELSAGVKVLVAIGMATAIITLLAVVGGLVFRALTGP